MSSLVVLNNKSNNNLIDSSSSDERASCAAKPIEWLIVSGDKKGKLPPRYKRILALTTSNCGSIGSMILLHQGLISNTSASICGRMTKAELSEYSIGKQMSILSVYLLGALFFDYSALNLSPSDPAKLVAGTLAIDSMTKQFALHAKKWMKPKKGLDDETVDQVQVEQISDQTGNATETQEISEKNSLQGLLDWMQKSGDDSLKTPPRYKRYSALLVSETATIASGIFLNQGIVTMTATLFHGRLVKAETKEWDTIPKISCLAIYTILSAGLDFIILSLMEKPKNDPGNWIAASIAFSISLKLMAELSQKWMNPNMKMSKKQVQNSVSIEELPDDVESQSLSKVEDKSLNPIHLMERSWKWLRESSEENRPSRLTCASAIIGSTATSIFSILYLKQGLVSKVSGMFQGRLLKAEVSGPSWDKKKQYIFVVGLIISALMADTLILKRDLTNPKDFVVATVFLNLMVKIIAIDCQRWINPNFVDDEDEDEVEAPEKVKKEKKVKKDKTTILTSSTP